MPARKTTLKKISFSLSAPAAQQVQVAGDFTQWDQAPVALKKQKGGIWKATVSLEAGRYEYRFLVDGLWQDDPSCAVRAPNGLGSENCVVVVI